MKNRIFKKLLICCIIFPAVSCEDFLETEPESFIASTEYYQTEEDLEKGVIGIYAGLQTVYETQATTELWALLEMRSDNTTFQYNEAFRNEQDLEDIDEFMVVVENEEVEEAWNDFYNVILQANMVLANIENVPFSSEAVKRQYRGEASFLRAFSYFHLVRLFGGVPLILEPAESPDEVFSDRASEEQVYMQILDDVGGAVNDLSDNSPGAGGRITEGAARSLLGEVYLTQHEYPAAIEQFRLVESMGYNLMENYADIFDPNFKNNEESIFEIQFQHETAGGEEASGWIYRFAPHNSGTDLVGFNGVGSASGNNIPTKDMVSAYETGDERKEASIAFYIKDENEEYDVALGDSIPFIKKYFYGVEISGQTNENFPVYRLGGILLWLAEALNENGDLSEAENYLNRVRERADLPRKEGLSQDQLRQAIFEEQRVELAFENHRWYQLLRTGKALEVMNEHGEEIKEYTPRLFADTYNVTQDKLLYPLPAREVRLNGLDQNP